MPPARPLFSRAKGFISARFGRNLSDKGRLGAPPPKAGGPSTGLIVTAIALRSWLAILALSGALPLWAAECTRLVFSAHPDYPPYHWREGDRIAGASVALTGQILDAMGIAWEARYVGPWLRVLKTAEVGEIDLVVSLKPTPERAAFLAFSEAPSFPNPMALFVPRDRPLRFERFDDLVGKRGGKSAGDRFGDEFDQFAAAHLQIEEADGLGVNFQKLAAGRIDYVVTGLYTGRAQLATMSLSERLVALPRRVNEGHVHHGFAKNGRCLGIMAEFDRRLARIARTPLPRELLERALADWMQRGKGGERP
jgi:polar amino acid transport system substrate-binding protein